MKNGKTVPVMEVTDNSRKEENIVVHSLISEEKIAVKRQEGQKVGQVKQLQLSALLYCVMLAKTLIFFSTPSKARLTAFPHHT